MKELCQSSQDMDEATEFRALNTWGDKINQ